MLSSVVWRGCVNMRGVAIALKNSAAAIDLESQSLVRRLTRYWHHTTSHARYSRITILTHTSPAS